MAGKIDSPAPNSGPGGRLSDFLTVPHFWRVTLSFGLWWFAGAIVYIQIAPSLVEKGFTTASGGSLSAGSPTESAAFGAIGPQS